MINTLRLEYEVDEIGEALHGSASNIAVGHRKETR
jgi:hypothetical protein